MMQDNYLMFGLDSIINVMPDKINDYNHVCLNICNHHDIRRELLPVLYNFMHCYDIPRSPIVMISQCSYNHMPK